MALWWQTMLYIKRSYEEVVATGWKEQM